MHKEMMEQADQRPSKATEWLAFIQNEQAKEIYISFAHHCHKISQCYPLSSLNSLTNWAKSGVTPLVVFIEISEMEPPYVELQQIINSLPKTTQLIVLGEENDIHRYRQLQRMGINEYLLLPITEELLMQAFVEPSMKKNTSSQKKKTLIPIVGARGGVGATTVAINAAYNWSLLPNHRVCLVDLDTQTSDIALNLKIVEHEELVEALSDIERIDEHFITGLLAEKSPNFFTITNNWSMMHPIDDSAITDTSFQHFLMLLFEKVDSVFIDLSFPFNKKLANIILMHANSCLLVTDMSLSGTRSTMHMMQWLNIYAPDLDIKLIANLTRPLANVDLLQSGFQQALGKQENLFLPYSKETQESTLNGEPLILHFNKTIFAKNMKKFMDTLAQEYLGLSVPNKSIWQRLRERL